MGILDNYETADTAFKTGSVLTENNETLLQHLHGLSNQNNINAGTQHRDIIRGLTINNILLQRHIDSLQQHITALDAKNSKLQWWVVVLAVAALIGTVGQTIGTGIQTYIAVMQYNPTSPSPQPTAPQSPTSTPKSAVPNPAEAPSSRPAIAPKP